VSLTEIPIWFEASSSCLVNFVSSAINVSFHAPFLYFSGENILKVYFNYFILVVLNHVISLDNLCVYKCVCELSGSSVHVYDFYTTIKPTVLAPVGSRLVRKSIVHMITRCSDTYNINH
jgi:hypothetical protein